MNPAGVQTAATMRGVLSHVSRGASILSAKGKALGRSQGHQDDRGPPADGSKGRQQTHREGRETHDDDRHQKGVLAANQIADSAEHQGAKRPDQKTHRIGCEGRKQGGRFIAFREEERGEERCECGVQIKVVPLENGPH